MRSSAWRRFGHDWRSWAIVALSLLTVAAVVLTVLGKLPGTGSRAADGSGGQDVTRPLPDVAPAQPVLQPVGEAAPLPTSAGLARVLAPLLKEPGLGSQVGVAVVDLATNALLYGRNAEQALSPASTTKLLTSAAALDVLGDDHRLTTSTVRGARPSQVVLVGGGDPTLTVTTERGPAAPASLQELAAQTATRLLADGVRRVTLTYDTSLFAPPPASPGWPAEYVATGVVAPVTALEVRDGRLGQEAEGSGPRSPDPAAAAAQAFAQQLAGHGVTVAARPRPGRAPDSAEPLASVQSPPLADLVEGMLTTSDNDLAEALAHHVAVAVGEPADFAGAAAAVTSAVAGLGVPTSGVRLYDGSGLAPATAIPAATLAGVLAVADDPGRPQLRPILGGLPIAGFTGTLDQRFDSAGTRQAAGLVRAKTGTLRTVGALAGTLDDASGRVLGFAFVADRVPGGAALEARAALDEMAAALARCGCAGPVAAPPSASSPPATS